MKGIDVSKYQGKIDWAKVKDAGIEFAIVKAGFGMYEDQVDPMFKTNIQGALNVQLPVGVYWFSYATTKAEGEKEAEVCLKVCAPYLSRLSLPVFFDQEYYPAINKLSNQERTDICNQFITAVSKQAPCGLYCSRNWWDSMLYPGQLDKITLWIADYGGRDPRDLPNVVCWQYADDGKVNGIPAKVDLDEGFDNYLNPKSKGLVWEHVGLKYTATQDGKQLHSQWVKDKGFWYWLDDDGNMLTGWQKIKDKWYYLNPESTPQYPLGACIITDSSGAITGR